MLSHVFAHAHLAAVGWASLMVVGVGYRLLPMVLPARMPSGRTLYASAILIEAGVAGLFVTLVRGGSSSWLFAWMTVAGLAVFLLHVVWMLRHPRPRPPGIVTPDPAVLHAAAAFLSLVCACGLGVWLAVASMSEITLRVATAYGVFGIVGFLAQMVVAMEGRLFPLHAWYWAFANTGWRGPVLSPHAMPWRTGQYAVFALWVIAVPALAGGLAFSGATLVRASATCLLVATILDSVQLAVIVRHAYRRKSGGL